MINKETLTFAAKFYWLLIRYRLFLMALDNVLSWEGSDLIDSMMVGYDIDFAAILRHEIHDRVFSEVMNLPLPCLIQIL